MDQLVLVLQAGAEFSVVKHWWILPCVVLLPSFIKILSDSTDFKILMRQTDSWKNNNRAAKCCAIKTLLGIQGQEDMTCYKHQSSLQTCNCMYRILRIFWLSLVTARIDLEKATGCVMHLLHRVAFDWSKWRIKALKTFKPILMNQARYFNELFSFVYDKFYQWVAKKSQY